MIDLRCSGADGWSRCGFRPHLETRPGALPDDENDAAREGTAAAWVAECVINGDASCADDLVGRVHKNGVEINPDMARHLTPYIDMAKSRHGARAENFGEIRAPNGAFRIVGTSDLWSWSRSPTDFHVDDLKFGFGIVETTTAQILAYAMIAHYAFGITPERWHLGIFQPRAMHPLGPYRVRTLTHAEFLVEADQLWRAANNAANPTHATPGDQCNHCRAAAICTALTHSVYQMFEPVTARSYLEPNAQQLADELDFLERAESLISARISAVRAEAGYRIDNAQTIPGWAKMPTLGKRQWKFDAATIEAFTGVSVTESKLVTPAEAERRGASKDAVAALTKRPTVSYTLQRYDADKIAQFFPKR